MPTQLPPIIVCGIARDCALDLEATLTAIDRVRKLCERSYCIIVTNDNSDSTATVLEEWAAVSECSEIIKLDGLAQAYPDRIDRIAVARNFYLKRIGEEDFQDFPLVCVLDFDGPNNCIQPQDLHNAVRTDEKWDALFANQQPAYYDIYALRHPLWCPSDCWKEVSDTTRFPFRRRKQASAIQRYVRKRQFAIPASLPLIPVESAFGGLALYRKEALHNCWYGSRDRHQRTVCEHVILHQQMRARGAKLFIAPGLLNAAPQEHLGETSGQAFPLDYLVHCNALPNLS
jgi:hypothetical protein